MLYMSEEYKEITRRLANLETHIINLIVPIQGISNFFKNTHDVEKLLHYLDRPLQVDDSRLNARLKEFRECMVHFELKVDEFNGKTEQLDITQTFAEIKYIGKRLKEIEEKIVKIQENGIKKQIELNFSCDGYDLVKKPSNFQKDDELESEDLLKYALESLPSKESYVIVHRLGLEGQEEKTFRKIAMKMKCSASYVSTLYSRGIRRLRHPTRIDKVRACGDKKLQQAVLIE